MFPILESNRLILNQFSKEDKNVVFFLKSDREVNKYIKRDFYVDIKQAEDFIELINNNFAEDKSYSWALRLKDQPEMIGSICLWNFSDDKKTAELGYDLKPEFHGKGLMTEAVELILDYGFSHLKLQQIEAFTSFKNAPSIALLEKFGFKLNENRKDEDNDDNLIFELKSNS